MVAPWRRIARWLQSFFRPKLHAADKLSRAGSVEGAIYPVAAKTEFIVFRRISATPSAWAKGDATKVQNLASSAFSADNTAVSVFRTDGAQQEALTLAALHLTTKQGVPSKLTGVRIAAAEVASCGVELRPSGGTTGVAAVDACHLDLHGTAEQFQSLTKLILDAQRQGDDRVRTVACEQVVHQIDDMLTLSAGSIDESARRNAERALAQKRSKKSESR